MNKTVLITGGAKGLGEAIARKYAKNSYNVIVTYYNSKAAAENLVSQIQSEYNVEARCEFLDVTDEDSIRELFKNIANIDVLINNAAFNNDEHWLEHSKEDILKTLDTNLVGPYLMIKYAYPSLKKNNGSIVNIASTNGIDTMYPESFDYDASKAGLINLTRNLTTCLAPNIRINAVAPGWINTPKTSDMNPLFKEEELKRIALKRFAEPEEVAEVVYFLGSDLSSFMTGSIVRVDGGNNYGL